MAVSFQAAIVRTLALADLLCRAVWAGTARYSTRSHFILWWVVLIAATQNWGWACERVLGVDVVTADGELVHCDKNENTDLYFAARGAGPGMTSIFPVIFGVARC